MHDMRELTRGELAALTDKDLRMLKDSNAKLSDECDRQSRYYKRTGATLRREIKRRERNAVKGE